MSFVSGKLRNDESSTLLTVKACHVGVEGSSVVDGQERLALFEGGAIEFHRSCLRLRIQHHCVPPYFLAQVIALYLNLSPNKLAN